MFAASRSIALQEIKARLFINGIAVIRDISETASRASMNSTQSVYLIPQAPRNMPRKNKFYAEQKPTYRRDGIIRGDGRNKHEKQFPAARFISLANEESISRV